MYRIACQWPLYSISIRYDTLGKAFRALYVSILFEWSLGTVPLYPKPYTMASTPANIHFSATVGELCFYQWEGRTFARKKSSLTTKRVLKEKAFAKTRRYARSMGTASRIASEIYKSSPVRGRWIFRAITGEAASLLYAGKTEEQVRELLWEKYIQHIRDIDPKVRKSKNASGTAPIAPKSKQAKRELRSIFLKQWKRQGKPEQIFLFTWNSTNHFNPATVRRRSEYFLGPAHASWLE